MNLRLRFANYAADHTIFVGSWLKDLNIWRKDDHRSHSVILNGADQTIFHARDHKPWDGHGPLKLVTHHWGGNWLKGFDIYQRIDEMLEHPAWKGRIEFTYIGNVPKGFTFKNATLVSPLDAEQLAGALQTYHVYVTGSQNEPGGNHQNEGALCGLPLLYRNSGCMQEYCDGFGEQFNSLDDFELALQKMMENYPAHQAAMSEYPHTAESMVQQYLQVFDELMDKRSDIVSRRHLLRNPVAFLINQFLM